MADSQGEGQAPRRDTDDAPRGRQGSGTVPEEGVAGAAAGPGAPGGGAAEAPVEAPVADGGIPPEVEALQAEIAGLRDRLARARADYENLQKRVERDAALERDRVKARALEAFLQVYEFGKMAEFEALRNPGPLAEGVKMLVREFDRMLQAEGVRPLGTVGEPFDPRLHEAVAHEAGDVPAGHVSRVVAQGYQLGERVLRYAKVAVAPDEEE